MWAFVCVKFYVSTLSIQVFQTHVECPVLGPVESGEKKSLPRWWSHGGAEVETWWGSYKRKSIKY